MSFVDNLRAAMDQAGVSQSELARRLGIRSQAVNQWFRPGGTAPRGRRLFEVAAALGIELSALLSEPTPPTSEKPMHADADRSRLLASYDAMGETAKQALLRIADELASPTRPTGTASPPFPPGGRVKENPVSGECGAKPDLRVVADAARVRS
jgi:transcriptional regulator with XRE-family HTH domain